METSDCYGTCLDTMVSEKSKRSRQNGLPAARMGWARVWADRDGIHQGRNTESPLETARLFAELTALY